MFANEWVEVKIKNTKVKIHAISTEMVSVKTRLRELNKKGLLAKLDFIFDKTFTELLQYGYGLLNIPKGFI